jgi:ribosome-binding protein aMBF1 (putative translation factor)
MKNLIQKLKKIFSFKNKEITVHPSNWITDEDFTQAVNDCLEKNNLTISQMANKIQMPTTLIEDWSKGKNIPLMIMRRSVISALEKFSNDSKI